MDTSKDAAVEEDRADTPIYHQPFTAPGVQIPVRYKDQTDLDLVYADTERTDSGPLQKGWVDVDFGYC